MCFVVDLGSVTILVQKGQLYVVNCWTIYISLISNWKLALENVFSIQQRQIFNMEHLK